MRTNAQTLCITCDYSPISWVLWSRSVKFQAQLNRCRESDILSFFPPDFWVKFDVELKILPWAVWRASRLQQWQHLPWETHRSYFGLWQPSAGSWTQKGRGVSRGNSQLVWEGWSKHLLLWLYDSCFPTPSLKEYFTTYFGELQGVLQKPNRVHYGHKVGKNRMNMYTNI